MRLKLFGLVLISLTGIFSACDRLPCENKNMLFNQASPDSKEYKDELIKEIESIGTKNITFWYEGSVVRGGNDFIKVRVKGKELCAIGDFEVRDWGKLNGAKNNDSYIGAELRGFNFFVERSESGATFLIFDDLEKIID